LRVAVQVSTNTLYDSPAAERIDEERSALRADVFTM
jgi:hypothetical protein